MKTSQNNLWIFFVLITCLYLYTYPINNFIFNEWPIIFKNYVGKDDYFFFLCLFFLAIILPGFLINQKLQIKDINFIYIVREYALIIFLLILFICYIYIQTFTGIDNSISFNRKNRELLFFNSQEWVLFSIVTVTISFICIFFYKNLSPIVKILFLIHLICYIYLERYQLGARRYSTTIFVFFYIVIINKKNINFLSFKNIIILIIFGLIMLNFGALREIIYHKNIQENYLKNVLTTNEFTAIGYGVYNILTSDHTDIIKSYGNSITMSPLLLIPRKLWDEKPLSLANTIGYPISFPLELFINFEFLSIIIYFIMSFGIYYFGVYFRNSILYPVIFSYIIELNRTDFFGLLYILIITYFCLKIIVKNGKI